VEALPGRILVVVVKYETGQKSMERQRMEDRVPLKKFPFLEN